MDLKLIFGKNLKYYRYKKGYTQDKLAEMINVSTNYIGQLERGLHSADFVVIENLCEVLDIDVSQLFTMPKDEELPSRVNLVKSEKIENNISDDVQLTNIFDFYNLIGQNIKKFRKTTNESQEKFAENIGKSRGFISQIESKVDTGVSLDTLFIIARKYNIDIRILFENYEKFMNRK